MKIPYVDPNGSFKLYIPVNSQFVVFESLQCPGLEAGFYGQEFNSVASVFAPDYLSGHMYGLCGQSCDGSSNDLITADGIDVSRDPEKFDKITQSYCVDESHERGFGTDINQAVFGPDVYNN